jgi:hypothetical protein
VLFSVVAGSRPGKLGRSSAAPLQSLSGDLEKLLEKFTETADPFLSG